MHASKVSSPCKWLKVQTQWRRQYVKDGFACCNYFCQDESGQKGDPPQVQNETESDGITGVGGRSKKTNWLTKPQQIRHLFVLFFIWRTFVRSSTIPALNNKTCRAAKVPSVWGQQQQRIHLQPLTTTAQEVQAVSSVAQALRRITRVIASHTRQQVYCKQAVARSQSRWSHIASRSELWLFQQQLQSGPLFLGDIVVLLQFSGGAKGCRRYVLDTQKIWTSSLTPLH